MLITKFCLVAIRVKFDLYSAEHVYRFHQGHHVALNYTDHHSRRTVLKLLLYFGGAKHRSTKKHAKPKHVDKMANS